MQLGKYAFSMLEYKGFDIAAKDEYYVLRQAGDDEANQLYLKILEEESDGLYIQDIMRGALRMTIHAYQEIYLSKAQSVLGDAFDDYP